MTTVVNIKTEKCDVYIGRKKEGMHFGNPFTHLKNVAGTIQVGSRAEAILCFKLWIEGISYQDVEPERRKWILENLKDLKGKKIGCFCKPLDCHGDWYAEEVEKEKDTGV